MSDRAPASATESYADDIIDLLHITADLEEELACDAVVWAGDVFHYKQPSRTSHATVLRMIEVVNRYKNLWIVTGNHDISNDVLDSVHTKQPLGILLEAGAHELDGWNCLSVESYPGDGDNDLLPVFGVPWQQRWLDPETPDHALARWRANPYGFDRGKALVVTHAPIYPPTEAQSVMFELVPTSGDHGIPAAMGHLGYVYYGHIHEDHGIWTDDGVTFANMGAISRGSLTEYNMNRSIKVALWDSETGFTEVPVPHKPASEVFRVQEVMEERADRISLDNFLSEVGSSTLDISSTRSVIDHVSQMNVPPRVKQKAIDLLEEFE